MNVHILQHVPFEGPARLAPILEKAGHPVRIVRPFAGDPLPESGDVEALVVLGGPMGLADADAARWLDPEARLVEALLAAGRPILGICLGAQVIAHVLGAAVRRIPEPEIGWFPVRRVAGAEKAVLGSCWPGEATVFHWHGDGFDTPPGAVRLAESDGWPDQAFAVGDRVLGLQFHVETDREAAAALIRHGAADLARGGRFVQDPERILGREDAFARLPETAALVLGPFLGVLGSRPHR